MNTKERGTIGEEKAADYLKEKGWKILERNFRTKTGEIDIIAQDNTVLVFLEIKAWRTMPEDSLEYSINRRKKRKILAVSKEFLEAHGELADSLIRYDLIFQSGDWLEHYADVFAETGQV